MHAPLDRDRSLVVRQIVQNLERREERRRQSARGVMVDGRLEGGLMAFIRRFWSVLEPNNALVEGWALYAIILHLEAVTYGEIKRLLITVPPGFMKSLCTDVFWPAWEWGPCNKAYLRYVAFSYSASLTQRDNERFRDLVVNPEYQALWGDRVSTVKIGAEKISNNRQGWKLASSVGGVGTGERGNRILLDDAHNIKEAESEIVRTETTRWFRESMSDRLNSMESDVIVVIMQRSHQDDVAGLILELELPYDHLMIPMEYDWDRQVDGDGEPYRTCIGWHDPRFVAGEPDECDGELAWPERFPPEVCEQLRTVKGPYAYAGQYQQAPAPRGGGLFKRAWWQVWDAADGRFPPVEYVLASLDSAFTEKESNSPSALTVWGVFVEPESGKRRIILLHAWRKFLQFSGVRIERGDRESAEMFTRRTQHTWGLVEWLAHTCTRFKVSKLLIEAKASGMSAASELRNRYGLQDWAIQLCPVKGDKFSRALAAQPTFSQLMVYAPVRDWAEMVIEEMEVFPKGRYSDLTDSTTQAIKHFRDTGLAQTDEEVHAGELETVRHRPKPKALYPV